MSDCDHSVIKCMKCHRYVGIHEQTIPVNPAVQRIQELEAEVRALTHEVVMLRAKYVRKSPARPATGGMQHEFA